MVPSLLLRQAAVRLQQQQQQLSSSRCGRRALHAAAAFSQGPSTFSCVASSVAGPLPLSAGRTAAAAAAAGASPLPLRQLSALRASPLAAAAPAAATAASSPSPSSSSPPSPWPAAAAAAAGSSLRAGRAGSAAAALAAWAPASSSAAAGAAVATAARLRGQGGGGERQLGCTYTAKRTYLHFNRAMPEDFELPADTMPANVGELLSKNPKDMDFFENYWYWKLRGEATVLDPESLPAKSYKQLARDMGMQVVNEETEHMVGLLELYEHLKTAAFVGPFGTIEKPVLCPSVTTDRIVGCTGGAGDKEHVPLWFRCREGFLYRCGECDQIFMLVRVFYSLPDGKDPFPVDPDVDDVFDAKLLEKGEKMWNSAEYVHWPAGHAAYSQLFLEGKWGNPVPQKLSQELRAVEA